MKPPPFHLPATSSPPRSVTGHKVFIPVTDAMLYDHPELITAPLQPYQIDNPCFHWMATVESPGHASHEPAANRRLEHCDYENQLSAGDSVQADSAPLTEPGRRRE